MSLQLPSGPNATISSGDWSGVGTGDDGANWDFQTSTLLVESIGTNGVTDMFLPREWSLKWLSEHSRVRFNATPSPLMLAGLWGFGDLDKIDANHIIFTNGLNDGWSVGGVMKENLAKEIHVLNMPNGAHQSDLLHSIIPNDTPDVKATRAAIIKILEKWILSKE